VAECKKRLKIFIKDLYCNILVPAPNYSPPNYHVI